MNFRLQLLLASVLVLFVFPATHALAAPPTPAPGFQVETYLTGLTQPTGMVFVNQDRLFVTEKRGWVRLVKAGVLQNLALVSGYQNTTDGERGLLGIALDPDFANNRYFYFNFTYRNAGAAGVPFNRVFRYVDDADMVSGIGHAETFEMSPLSSATNHNGGAIHFGVDGKLYIATGDNGLAANAQDLTNTHGKILRINPDGTIPQDNPFYNTLQGDNRAIYAYGLRNAFSFAVHPETGKIYVNDVGQSTTEEINELVAGANYGWPACEGTCTLTSPAVPGDTTSPKAYTNPIYSYGHGAGTTNGRSIAGATFNAKFAFLPQHDDAYFFGDYVNGWVNVRNDTTGAVTNVVSGGAGIVDVEIGPDGALYVASLPDGAIYRVTATNSNQCRGDLNRDGIVDIDDYSLLLTQLFSANPNPPQSDITGDGEVDLDDLSFLIAQLFGVCA